MLKDEAILYSKLTGKDGEIIRAFLEGYERGKADAQPEHIRGHWICDRSWSEGVGMGESYGHYWKCDKCGHLEKSNGGVCGCNFCSNCGADMKGKHDD